MDLHEHGKHIGRKFLVAGQGGFNITNSVEGDDLIAHYAPSGFLDPALRAFGPTELREWLKEMGMDTFVGTSGRVFPVKGIEPIDVLTRIRSDCWSAVCASTRNTYSRASTLRHR